MAHGNTDETLECCVLERLIILLNIDLRFRLMFNVLLSLLVEYGAVCVKRHYFKI